MSTTAVLVTPSKTQSLLQPLRDKVGEEAAALDDQFLEKFLIARDHDLDKTALMLSNHLRWRRENNVDGIMSEYFGATPDRPDVHDFYELGFFGEDWEGNPIFVDRCGKARPAEAIAALGHEYMMRWHICCMEVGRERYRQKGARGVLLIMDAKGVGMWFFSSANMRFFREVSALDQDNYPEHVIRIIVINSGTIAPIAWKIMSPFLDPATRAKVHFLNKDYHSKLEEWVGKDQLPVYLGGKCDAPLRVFGAARPP